MKIKPYIDIVKLVWPLALGMVNTAVMQFADRSYLAAHSQDALAAVLPAGMLMWIFAGFFQSVVVSCPGPSAWSLTHNGNSLRFAG